MKIKVIICAVMAVASAAAATYKVDLDRPDGIYRCGETATFTVRLLDKKNLAGSERPFAVLDNFGTTVFTNLPLDVSSVGAVFKISGTLREPGFLRLSLPPTRRGGKDPFVFSAGFEPEKIQKGSPSPEDFDAFWADARARLARDVLLDAQVTRVPERSTAVFDFYRISFATFGRRVHGYMSVPKDKSKAPFPVDFEVNAAGFGGWTNDMSGRGDAICVRFSVYPFPPDWRWKQTGLEAKYKEMDAALAARAGRGQNPLPLPGHLAGRRLRILSLRTQPHVHARSILRAGDHGYDGLFERASERLAAGRREQLLHARSPCRRRTVGSVFRRGELRLPHHMSRSRRRRFLGYNMSSLRRLCGLQRNQGQRQGDWQWHRYDAFMQTAVLLPVRQMGQGNRQFHDV